MRGGMSRREGQARPGTGSAFRGKRVRVPGPKRNDRPRLHGPTNIKPDSKLATNSRSTSPTPLELTRFAIARLGLPLPFAKSRVLENALLRVSKTRAAASPF